MSDSGDSDVEDLAFSAPRLAINVRAPALSMDCIGSVMGPCSSGLTHRRFPRTAAERSDD